MKIIPLTQRQITLVDDADYEWLRRWKWQASWDRKRNTFYACRAGRLRSGKRVRVYMHRQILGLRRSDPRYSDHINHETLDNRRKNLRIVTSQENAQNRRNVKGYKRDKRSGKYIAAIGVDAHNEYLGAFGTESEAQAAHLAAKRIFHPTAPTDGSDRDGGSRMIQ